MRHNVRIRLDLVDQPVRFQPFYDFLSRGETVESVHGKRLVEIGGRSSAGDEIGIIF